MVKTMVAGLALALATAANAAGGDGLLTADNLSGNARSFVVGTFPTGGAGDTGSGDSRYLASDPVYSGVAQLQIALSNGTTQFCTGSLLGNSMTIVTAGHCVSSGGGNVTATAVYAYFNDHSVDTVNLGDPRSTVIQAASIRVNPLYTGNVVDDHDIALLTLASAAPSYANVYQIYTGGDLTGLTYNVVGFGLRSDTGGLKGEDLPFGRIRQGQNRYDFRFGDPTFGGYFDSHPPAGQPAGADIDYSYLADFDSGSTDNDASCKLGGKFGNTSAQFCNTGLGALEVGTASGDSGGPEFVNGQIASITSYGLSTGTMGGDVDNLVNSSFGEFDGFVPLEYNITFLTGAVPEPGVWSTMILGMGAIGALQRRRRAPARAAAR